MNNKIFKCLLTVGCLLCSISASAYDFKSGLCYNFAANGVEVTYEVVYDEDTGKWVRKPYTSSAIIIPSTVTYNGNTYSVTSISGDAFLGCSSLKSVTIPSSVTSISDYAFGGCNNLTRVDITDLKQWCKIGFGGFSANPLEYADNLYVNGDKISDLKIPDDVTVINDYVFQGYSGLVVVTIPNSVTSIGYKVFNGCGGLTTVNYNATNCQTMGSNLDPVFKDCAKLAVLNIGNEVNVIPDCAFVGCTGLTSVDIPNSVTSVGWSSFRYCTGLTSVTVGSSVTVIDDYAFDDCI